MVNAQRRFNNAMVFQSYVSIYYVTLKFNVKISLVALSDIVCTPPPPLPHPLPFCWGRGGGDRTSYQIFKKSGGLGKTSTLRGGLLEKRG